ncbi:MAG: hypothetical protein EBU46_00930 [Nitrosomonadaceae bacterium]|nr:hypothetical protein [Nitrosomonadaceae bacterium]
MKRGSNSSGNGGAIRSQSISCVGAKWCY